MTDDATFALELDRLVVERSLGAGAFGEVLLAREPGSPRPLALKLLVGADPRRLERFRREAELTARLDHPGIVRVHGAGTYRGRPAIVYALVEGARPLHEVAPTLALPARPALVRDVARALAFAHARGVVHRDVKAENVLVDADGRARLADFGLAAAVDSQTLTRTGQLLGTPYSMSPEQIVGQEAGAPSDVWGLGVLLHLVATGARPFDGETWPALAQDVVRGRSPAPSSIVEAAPAGLDDVVAAALRKEPAARPSAAELAAALDGVLAGRGGRGRRGGPLVAALGALGALAAAATVWAVAARAPAPTGGGERPPPASPDAPPHVAASPAEAPRPRTGLEGWAAELAAVRSFSLVVEDRVKEGAVVGRRLRLDGTLGPVAGGPASELLRAPLALSRLRVEDVDGGPAFDSAAAPAGGAELPMRRYAHDLASARGELVFEGRTGVAREVTGLAPKPKVARGAALDMFGQIEADWGRILPDAAWIRRCLGNLMSLAPGPSGERRLGQRTLWTGWDDHFEAQLALEPTGAGPLRVVARDVSPASGTRGGRATFSGEVRLAGGRLAELRLEAEVDTKDPSGQYLARRVVQTLTLEPPTR